MRNKNDMNVTRVACVARVRGVVIYDDNVITIRKWRFSATFSLLYLYATLRGFSYATRSYI